MSGAATTVMIVAMLLIWGSLAASLAWAVRAGRRARRSPGGQHDVG